MIQMHIVRVMEARVDELLDSVSAVRLKPRLLSLNTFPFMAFLLNFDLCSYWPYIYPFDYR